MPKKYSNVYYDMSDLYEQGLSEDLLAKIAYKLHIDFLDGNHKLQKENLNLRRKIRDIVANHRDDLLPLEIEGHDFYYDDCVRLKEKMDELMLAESKPY